jgi:hypothetical protein
MDQPQMVDDMHARPAAAAHASTTRAALGRRQLWRDLVFIDDLCATVAADW